MARYIGSVCRLCRREGMKLFFKGERCYTDKCAIEKRNYPPGQHGISKRRTKSSEYGIQLREKQKVKRLYGLLEKQFKLTYKVAEKQKGKTGENLLILLERRLDNTIYRMGFARSRAEARQIVKHSHILLNNKKNNIPSTLVKVEDTITIREKSQKIPSIKDSLESSIRKGLPAWVEVNSELYSGKLLSLPTRDDIGSGIEEQLIVELYSR